MKKIQNKPLPTLEMEKSILNPKLSWGTINDRIAVLAFRRTMKSFGQYDWDVQMGDDEGMYEVGYDALYPGEWTAVYLLAEIFPTVTMVKKKQRVLNKYNKWELFVLKNHPGRFNPRDGGTPPETEEVKLGEFEALKSALRTLTVNWVESIFEETHLSVWEADLAEKQSRDMEHEDR